MLNDSVSGGRARDRGSARRRDATPRAARPPATVGRTRIAAAIARCGVRERLVLSLLLYERLCPVEVADALGISVRQVERTYAAMIAGLRRSLARPVARARTRPAASRLRTAA